MDEQSTVSTEVLALVKDYWANADRGAYQGREGQYMAREAIAAIGTMVCAELKAAAAVTQPG